MTTSLLAADWPQWRGATGSAISADVPFVLPAEQAPVWTAELKAGGYAGIAVSGDVVIVTDYDNGKGIVRAFKLADGTPAWAAPYTFKETLEVGDYGAAPRATPAIADGLVYVVGASGEFHAINLKTGKKAWAKSLARVYEVDPGTYGYCCSPSVFDGKLLVNVGTEKGGIVALNPKTGKELWNVKSDGASYGSFMVGTFGGVKQVVTVDGGGLGGWKLDDGTRLWSVAASGMNGNINTPVDCDGKLFFADDANGALLYAFEDGGKIKAEPIATSKDLAPEMCSPVYWKGFIYGTSNATGDNAVDPAVVADPKGLVVLDVNDGLKTVFNSNADGLDSYTGMIAGNDRVMAVTDGGTLVLIEAAGANTKILGKMPVSKGGNGYSALSGDKLLAHDDNALNCYKIK
jgi:outer membrane protein assembly factor BamB